jgi:hypothetical protein
MYQVKINNTVVYESETFTIAHYYCFLMNNSCYPKKLYSVIEK